MKRRRPGICLVELGGRKARLGDSTRESGSRGESMLVIFMRIVFQLAARRDLEVVVVMLPCCSANLRPFPQIKLTRNPLELTTNPQKS